MMMSLLLRRGRGWAYKHKLVRNCEELVGFPLMAGSIELGSMKKDFWNLHDRCIQTSKAFVELITIFCLV